MATMVPAHTAPQPPAKIDYPPLFDAAEATSRTGRRFYAGLITTDVMLLVAAAIAGSVTVGPARWQQLAAVVAAIVIATGIVLRRVNRSEKQDDNWFRGRAAAESIKSSSWRYMMRVEPYDSDDDDAAKELFLSTLEQIRSEYSDLPLATTVGGSQVPPAMGHVRIKDLPERQVTYRERRLNDQITWYADKARFHRKRSRILLAVGIAAEVGALAWLLARFAFSWNINIIGVFTSVAVAATALSQLNAHDELNQKYSAAQSKLQIILGRLPASDMATFAHAVGETESTISAENSRWIAKRV